MKNTGRRAWDCAASAGRPSPVLYSVYQDAPSLGGAGGQLLLVALLLSLLEALVELLRVIDDLRSSVTHGARRVVPHVLHCLLDLRWGLDSHSSLLAPVVGGPW